MQDNLHFFELEIYEIIREDCVRFLRKSTKENLALHDTACWFRFGKKQHHKRLDLPFYIGIEEVNIGLNHKDLVLLCYFVYRRSQAYNCFELTISLTHI